MEKNMEEQLLSNFRKEVKFLVPIEYLSSVRNQLSKLNFCEKYPSRLVTSIYFDTISEDFLNDSLEGIFKRLKIRFRYYNEGEDFRMEKKIKNDKYGIKEIYPINQDFISLNEYKEFEKLASELNNMSLKSTALVEYERNYYSNINNSIRITLDYHLKTKELIFGRTRALKNFFILEVKCDVNTNLDLNLNLYQQRFSKYSFARFSE